MTVDEILNAYRQGCQKLNCKPIAKVLKQIQVRPGLRCRAPGTHTQAFVHKHAHSVFLEAEAPSAKESRVSMNSVQPGPVSSNPAV